MCFTFLAAQGHDPGGSLLEHGQVDNCARLLAAAQEAGKRILLPTDIVVLSPDGVFGKGREPEGEMAIVGPDVPEEWLGLDIGPGTAAAFADEIAAARHRLLERPHGRVRGPPFCRRDEAVADAVASTKGFSVVGGGTAPAPSRCSAWTTRSTTSRPAAGPRSSSSRRVTSPGWRPCGSQPPAAPGHVPAASG